MKINDICYEKKFSITINKPERSVYFYFDYDERNAGDMVFQHLHPFYEILLLLSPSAVSFINGKPYDIKFGDLVLLRPALLHKSSYVPGDPSQRLVINFSCHAAPDDVMQGYLTLLSLFNEEIPIFRFADPYRKLVVTALNDIFTFIHSPRYDGTPLSQVVFQNKFIHFMYMLYSLREHNVYRLHKSTDALTQKIYEISAYILNNYHENLTLQGLAHQFFISPCYLSREFKRINHFTITNYIQMTRIRNAQYLLISSDLRISAIAQQCGFQSFSQFNRTFHRISGCSPSEFQKRDSLPSVLE